MRDMPIWWAWFLVLAFFLSVAHYPRLRHLVISLAAWTLFLFAARRFVPFARNWLFFLPIFLMASAAGLAWLLQRLVPATTRTTTISVSAVALAIALCVPVLHNGSVLTSTETGVLQGASQVADFASSQNIPPAQIFRNSTSDLPFQYYWWRRTGSRPADPTRPQLEAEGVHDPWFLLNTTYGEILNSFSKQHGYSQVQVLDEHSFAGAELYHVKEISNPAKTRN